MEFPSPGLTPGRRYGTAIMLLVLGLFVVGVIWYEGRSGLVAAILGALLIAGFVWYLRMIAPAPFTLKLTPEALVREQAGEEPLVIAWERFARVKEEQFSNKKIISVTVYKKVGARGVHRALVLYRDDLPRFDAFRQALRDATQPSATPWTLETVHE
jgi:hypothetical protein